MGCWWPCCTVPTIVAAFGERPSPNFTTKLTEAYDIETDTWSAATDGPSPRRSFQPGSFGNSDNFYSAGGKQFTLSLTIADLDRYTVSGDSWSSLTDMTTARSAIASTARVGTDAYVVGGRTSHTGPVYSDLNEAYDISGDSWSNKAVYTAARDLMGAEAVGTDMFCYGGADNITGLFKETEEYDTVGDSWTSKTDMPEVRSDHGTFFTTTDVYSIGGSTAAPATQLDVRAYSISGDSWSNKTDYPQTISTPGGASANGKGYLSGGLHGGSQDPKTYEYDPSGNSWTALDVFTARSEHAQAAA